MILIPLNLQIFQKCLQTVESFVAVLVPILLVPPLPINPGFVLTTPLTAARATSPENHKYKLKIHPDYVKIIIMISQKSYIGNLHGGGGLIEN